MTNITMKVVQIIVMDAKMPNTILKQNRQLWKSEYWLVKSVNEPLILFHVPSVGFVYIEDEKEYDEVVEAMLGAGVRIVSHEEWSKYLADKYGRIE